MLCGKLLWRSPHHSGPVDPTARTVGNRKIEFGTCLNGSSRPGRHGFQTKQQLYWFVPRRGRHQALNLHALHTYQQHTDTERSDRKIKIKTKGNQRGSTTTHPTNPGVGFSFASFPIELLLMCSTFRGTSQQQRPQLSSNNCDSSCAHGRTVVRSVPPHRTAPASTPYEG